jgi:hypothetical protein
MREKNILILILIASVLCTPLFAAQNMLKKRVLADLDCIHHIFDVKYAPRYWKKDFVGWDLDQSILAAKNTISSLTTPSLKECQIIVRDFFNSTRDYHVGVRFFSTESASLPFLIKGAQGTDFGRYFVCYVDRDLLAKKEFPFEIGDEILTFGGKPIHAVVTQLRSKEFGDNTFETDQALAEMTLTHRRGDMGHFIPQGKVEITGTKKGSRSLISSQLTWRYTSEKIRDFSRLGALSNTLEITNSLEEIGDLRTLLTASGFFQKFMVAHLWDKSYVGAFNTLNKHALGARTSYIPTLGKTIWKSSSDSIFDAYLFETPSGQRIGYIRLPHYLGDAEEVREFGETMNLFQERTSALVIDQINNPGGAVFYLYALAAILTDKPLHTPKHHIAMTQEEVHIAHIILPYLEQVSDDATACIVLGDSMEGYPVNFEMVKLMKQFCNFLIQQWNSGKLYSDPTFLFGVDDILPHPDYQYTRPILLLTNGLDFSGGDFFPAILQDNKRAVVFGNRTAGAGGYVLTTNYPNHSGIKSFVMTGSLAKRVNSEPLENLGVTPDIPYDLSVTDLQENYKEYARAILESVEGLARGM